MYKTRSGAVMRQHHTRLDSARVQADFEHYTLIAGIIIGVCFGLMLGFGW